MYKRIIVPLDGSDTAEQAMPYAQLLAKALKAEMELLRVFSPPSSDSSEPDRGVFLDQVSESFKTLAQGYLEEKAASLRNEGISVSTTALEGDPASIIVTEAEKNPETLIVMSTHGRSGITRWVMGSVTDKVLRASGYPMLIVRCKEEVPASPELDLNDIIVPLDGSSLAEQVIPHAVSLSRALGWRITLLRAIPSRTEYFMYMEYPQPNYDDLYKEVEQSAQEYLDKMRLEVSQLGASQVEARIVNGNAAAAINDYAHNLSNNIVAMTTHGRSGIGRWVLGSVVDRVVRQSEDPVLVVRAFSPDND